ncbi:MAG: Uma2 family endonuclease [Chloroflexi bacterium]|nr:Uma2 family endonuclease [Chloroflexota bacterium]
MGTPQFNAVAVLYDSLKAELRTRKPRPFLAGMLPIRYSLPPGGRVEQLAPDILVAPVPDYPRASYIMEQEGAPPSLVLEVVSPQSRYRDLEIKPERCERLGVREYALFAPRTPDGEAILEPPLQGYRLHGASGGYAAWESDEEGRLYSEVLELWLVVREGELRAQRRDGSWLPTLEEAEEEIARLRAELEGHRGS